jgi:hypothetical protein
MGRLYRIAIIACILGLFVAWPVLAAEPNLVVNGSFEEGFGPTGVANGWTAFSNGGHVNYGWHPDNWRPVVWDGQWSQLLEINTGGQYGMEKNRSNGIYQTVDVVPGATYRLTLHGMVRSTEAGAVDTAYGYRVQVGIDYNGGTDCTALDRCCSAGWTEMNWWEWPRLKPGYYETYSTDVKASTAKMTLFIRALKKWATSNQEGDYNIDGVSLIMISPAPEPTPVPAPATQLPETGVGLALPLAGIVLGGVALGARGLRVWRKRS